jgi:hypothetical protein
MEIFKQPSSTPEEDAITLPAGPSGIAIACYGLKKN